MKRKFPSQELFPLTTVELGWEFRTPNDLVGGYKEKFTRLRGWMLAMADRYRNSSRRKPT